MNLIPRYRRGDPSPVDAGLVFLRYHRDREMWVTPARLSIVNEQQKVVNGSQRQKPGRKEKATEYALIYGRTEKRKAKQAAYYSSPEVRERLRLKRLHDPVLIAKREKRALEKAAREEFKLTPEFAAKKLAKSRRDYARNRKNIIANAVRRLRANPSLRLKQNVSTRIRRALKSQKARKTSTAVQYLGCSILQLRAHLEKQFQPGMTWENMGANGWEIDHRVPLASFQLLDPHQARLAFHFENLQPLWKPANRKKSDKLPDGSRARDRNIIPFTAAA